MTRSNRVQVDFLVVTVPINSVDDEQLDNFARMTYDGELRKFYGYKGFLKDSIYIGDNGERMMIQVTGAKANDALSLIDPKWQGLSVARIDLQLTVLVASADSIIASAMPPRLYKSVRMMNLNEPGSTLYVGAPSSRCRLRIYNKTAQLGEQRVNDMEKLRIELQLRDDYADRALINMLAGAGDMFFRHYVFKMTDAYITNLVDRALKDSNMLAMIDLIKGEDVDRRKEWIEHSVIPALMKLYVYDKEYFENFVNRLKEMID